MTINVEQPICGYYALPDNTGCIRIFDAKGRLYYYRLADGGNSFNLRCGKYYTDSKIVSLPQPLQYITPTVPEPEKPSKDNFPDITLDIYENPNKASVNIKTGYIRLDPKFLDKPLPFITFVLFHEISHNKYFTEWKCDVNSANEMLKRGYNPTQCYYANYYCLSGKQGKRKEQLLDWLSKVKTK